MTVEKIELLPELSYAFLETNDPGKQVIAIQRGVSGYQMTTYDEKNPEHAKLIVKSMNAKLGVDPVQAECMLAGSMFGWNSKAADYNYAIEMLGTNPPLNALNPAGSIWTPLQALRQAQAALPDSAMASLDGVPSDLIQLITETIEKADIGHSTPDEIMNVLVQAREVLPTAWKNHGEVPEELIDELDRAIDGNSTNILKAQSIVQDIADKFGISISAWIPNEAFAGKWEFADAEFEGQEIRLGVSGGGVVQVNRDPFTPTGDRVPNVSIDAIEASIMAAANIQFPKSERSYSGTIVHQVENSIAVQSLGKGAYVAHDAQTSKSLVKGKSYSIKYDSQRKATQIKHNSKGGNDIVIGL